MDVADFLLFISILTLSLFFIFVSELLAFFFQQKVSVEVTVPDPKKLSEKERQLVEELNTLQNESNSIKTGWFGGGK